MAVHFGLLSGWWENSIFALHLVYDEKSIGDWR